jgi:uncharacterized protein (TIGR03437 family)
MRTALAALALSFALVDGVRAQVLDPLWEGPERLSTYEGTVMDRAIAVDSRGRSLACWAEDRRFEEQFRVYCRRFDGKTWTEKAIVEEVDSEFAGAITKLDVQIDKTDTVQLVWTGATWPIYHRRVSMDKALVFDEWSGFIDIPYAVFEMRLVTDVKGGMVLIYAQRPEDEEYPAGVFAIRSTDNGDTWSNPVRVDPGAPEGWTPYYMEADFDGSNALHVVFSYLGPNNYNVIEIKSAYSTDGGKSWSKPVALESLAGAEPSVNPEFLRLANPELQADGPNVHVTYPGGGPIGISRRHVYSTDSGRTWSQPASFFGGLEGAAGTDSLNIDSLGRVHMLAQVRYPQGIYHAMWSDGAWTDPELVYLIAEDAHDTIGPRVHAQYFEAVMDKRDRMVLLVETCAAGCIDNSTWPQNPITFGLHTIGPLGQVPAFTTVSSATFEDGEPIAAESIAAGFGAGLSNDLSVANRTPLPTDLGGVSVEVIDTLGDKRPAGIQFVSPGQINYVVPEPSYPGRARVRVMRNNQIIAGGRMTVTNVAPSIFTVNGQGTGVAAATWLFVAKDGTRSSGLIFDPQTGRPVPVDFDPSRGQLYISLFGTGIRHFREHVHAKIGDYETPVFSVGPQGQFDGLDQINLGPVPAFIGAGAEWDVSINVDGVESNRTILVTKDRQ